MTPDEGSARPTTAQLVELFGLEPLPVEGGMLVQTWRSPEVVDADDRDSGGKRAGTAAIAMLTSDPDSFSAMHRLPATEIWHFYLGDPVRMVLLGKDGSIRQPVLGRDVLAGQMVQVVVEAETWMGARLIDGGDHALFGCTMVPGFTSGDYEGGTLGLVDEYPGAADDIASLIRPESPLRMPPRR